MHKKRIGDKNYFYTSIRDSKGKVKTIYLGSNKRNAIKKERELGLNSSSNHFNLQLFSIILLLLIISFSGFFVFTGLNIINVTEVVEESSNNLSSLVEEEVFVDSLEDIQLTTLSNETSSSLLENNSVILNETLELNEINLLNVSKVNISLEINISMENISIINISNNVSLTNLSDINLTYNNSNLILNQSLIVNESVNMSVQTLQYDAVINQPVKWKKRILLSSPSKNISINLPNEATNITVIEILNGTEKEVELFKFKFKGKEFLVNESNLITGSVISDIGLFTNFLTVFSNIFSNIFSFTGYGIIEIEEGLVEEESTLIIEEEIEEIEIEYETPGPISIETNFSEYNKQIVVSSDIHYENILAFTEIKDTKLNSINLYWIVNGSRSKVDFLGYDTNDNQLVDYIEWIVPHLSNQTYEVDINILNVQSYPVVGGNWTVLFNTTGIANLTIKGFNGTRWSNESENSSLYDIKLLDLKCGENNVNYSWTNNSLFFENYNCNSTGKENSKVLTDGKHNLEFDFGGQKSYAYNDAGHSCSTISTSGSHTMTANITGYNTTAYCMVITASDVVFDCNGYIIDGTDSNLYNITGIYVNGSTQLNNVTVQNCKVYDFSWDIYFNNVTNSKIINNTISSRNTINESFKAITLDRSTNITVEDNTISLRGSSTITPEPLSGAIVLTGTSFSNVTNNFINDIDGDGIYLSKGDGGAICERNLVNNNKVNNTLSTTQELYAGIRLNECFNSTITGNNIFSEEICGSNCNKFGIYLAASDKNNITSNTIFNSSNDNIFITGSDFNLFDSNILNYTITSDGEGFELVGSSLSNIFSNNLIYSSSGAGLFIGAESNRNNFTKNSYFNSSYDGIEIYNSYNNTFTSSNISNNQFSGVYFENSTDNLFIDGKLVNNNLIGGNGDVGISGGSGGSHNFLNMSFNQSDINFTVGTTGRLIVKWYFDTFVNSSSGAVQDANVTMYDSTGSETFSALTSITGYIIQQNLTEYTHNISSKSYLTNYTLNTTKTGYISSSIEFNLTGNRQENIILGQNTAPTVSNVNLTSDDSNNRTAGNLTGGFSFSDVDGDTITINQTKWYLNNTEIDYFGDDTEDIWDYSGFGSDSSNGFDEDWDTYVTGPPSNEVPDFLLFVNYSIPGGNLSSKLESKHYLHFTGFCYNGSWIDMGFSSGASTFRENRTVSSSCLTYDNETLQIKIVLEGPLSGLTSRFYEEKIWWQLENSTVIGNQLTKKGETWIFGVRGYDGTDWSSWTNSSNLTISDTGCGDTIISSTTLTTNLTCPGTGIVIGADDVVLDCDGRTITYSTSGDLGYGVNNTGYDNVTIQNCNVVEGNSSGNGKHGIYFTSAENGTITNNNITTIGTSGYGMYFFSSSNDNTITNNDITTNGISGYGVLLDSSSNSIITNNDITTNGNGGYGIYFSLSSNSIITNNNITSENSGIILDITGESYTNTLIYNNSYGEVQWFDKTDLSISESGTIGLGTAINISNNLIIVDSASYNDNDGSGLNQSANLTFFGVSITGNAVAMRNGESCGDICGDLTNVSDTYYFDVSQFTNYSVGNNTVPQFDESLTTQTVTVGDTLNYDINCSDGDSDTITYYDDTSLFNINPSDGLINDTSISGDEGTHSIKITCADSYENITSTFNYVINSLASEEAVASSGGSSKSTEIEVECEVNEDCNSGFICLNGNCTLSDCIVDEGCDLDEKCIDYECSKIFDLRILNIQDSSINAGEEIDFSYYVLAMSNINNDVTIKYWLDDGEDLVLSPNVPGICGDGYVSVEESCDLGEKNTNILCIADYDSSCSYCTLDCALENVRGPYCGDDYCNSKEDSFDCSQDCGAPTLISKFVNNLKNMFKFTAFVVVGKINSEVIYIGEIGDEIENEVNLYVPTEVESGVYELHIKLNYQGSEVEAIKTIEVLEFEEEPEFALIIEEETNIYKYIYLVVLVFAIIILVFLIFKAYIEIKKLSGKIFRLKRRKFVKFIKKKPRTLIERNKLIRKIKKWKSMGYDTSVLELKLGHIIPIKRTKQDIKRKEFEKKMREWESKGYDTTILKHKLGMKSKVIRISKSNKNLSKNIKEFEKKIKEWKKNGYDTWVLEKRLDMLKRKD